jgi:hypothetical protein
VDRPTECKFLKRLECEIQRYDIQSQQKPPRVPLVRVASSLETSLSTLAETRSNIEITAEPRSHNQDELASTCSPTQQALLTNRSIPSPLPETATKSRKTSESGDSGTAAIAMKGSHPKDLEASASGKERKYIRVSTEHSERAEMAFITSPKQSLDLSNFDYSEDQFS